VTSRTRAQDPKIACFWQVVPDTKHARTKQAEVSMTKPMTKSQLVATLTEEMDTDKKTANSALDSLVEVITREVSAGGAVTLPGVGKI
jgi:vancomycin resistance protein YoaR